MSTMPSNSIAAARGGRARPGRIRPPAIAAMIFLLALPWSEVGAAPPAATLKDCTETFLLVDGDDDAVRAAVPPGYTLGSEPPLGDLWSITSTCASIQVGRRASGPGTITFLGAAIQSPEAGGTNPIHSYLFWAVTNHRALSKALSAAGLPAHYARDIRQTFTRGVVLSHGQLTVPWAPSPYRIASAQSLLTTHPHAHDAYWWHDGESGPQRIVVHHSEFAEHIADCGIATEEGTTLADLLGTSERSTPCFLQGPVDSTIEF